MGERITVLTATIFSIGFGFYVTYKMAFDIGVRHGVTVALHLPASDALEMTCLSLWTEGQNEKFMANKKEKK